MRLRDKDRSSLALYYIYCIHPIPARKKDGEPVTFPMKAYSASNEEQWFYYESEKERDEDLDFIARWMEARELGTHTE